jgi:hypothetical protein
MGYAITLCLTPNSGAASPPLSSAVLALAGWRDPDVAVGSPRAKVHREQAGGRHVFVDVALLKEAPDSDTSRVNWV